MLGSPNSYHNFTYNRANQMVASGTHSYLYDGHNRRVKKTDSNGTSYSFYTQDGTLIYRENEDGGTNYIYLGKKLIAKDGYIKENASKQHFRPFGSSIEGETDDVGYTGHKFDKALGLSYMQARYYDPIIGRFYGNDPVDVLGHLDGTGGIQGFNRFGYANNNPYRYTDPDGKSPREGGSSSTLAGVILDFALGDEHKNNKNRLAIKEAKARTGEKGSSKQNSRAKRRASRAAQRQKVEPRVAVSQPSKNVQGSNPSKVNLRGQTKVGLDGKTGIGIQDGSKDSSNGPDHPAAVDVGNLKAGEQPGRNGQPRIQGAHKTKAEIK